MAEVLLRRGGAHLGSRVGRPAEVQVGGDIVVLGHRNVVGAVEAGKGSVVVDLVVSAAALDLILVGVVIAGVALIED